MASKRQRLLVLEGTAVPLGLLHPDTIMPGMALIVKEKTPGLRREEENVIFIRFRNASNRNVTESNGCLK
jgi:hypothetical protein